MNKGKTTLYRVAVTLEQGPSDEPEKRIWVEVRSHHRSVAEQKAEEKAMQDNPAYDLIEAYASYDPAEWASYKRGMAEIQEQGKRAAEFLDEALPKQATISRAWKINRIGGKGIGSTRNPLREQGSK